MKKAIQKIVAAPVILISAFLLFAAHVQASASPTETVMELTEGSGEISSTSTGDKMEARQLVAEAENFYADPAAPLGGELARKVELLRKQRSDFTVTEAVDFIYERALSLN